MAPKTAKKAIKDALANLSPDNFQRFREELLDQEPRVKRNMVEGKNYLDVGNVLVDIFTEAKAPGVVVELLREIGSNNEADKLAQETAAKETTTPSSSDTVRPSAGETGAEGDCSGEHFVDKHYIELVARVSEIASILDELLNKKVMTQGMYEVILATPTTSDKMRKLYSGPLKAAGRDGKDVFYNLLEKYEKYLMDDLKKKK